MLEYPFCFRVRSMDRLGLRGLLTGWLPYLGFMPWPNDFFSLVARGKTLVPFYFVAQLSLCRMGVARISGLLHAIPFQLVG